MKDVFGNHCCIVIFTFTSNMYTHKPKYLLIEADGMLFGPLNLSILFNRWSLGDNNLQWRPTLSLWCHYLQFIIDKQCSVICCFSLRLNTTFISIHQILILHTDFALFPHSVRVTSYYSHLFFLIAFKFIVSNRWHMIKVFSLKLLSLFWFKIIVFVEWDFN